MRPRARIGAYDRRAPRYGGQPGTDSTKLGAQVKIRRILILISAAFCPKFAPFWAKIGQSGAFWGKICPIFGLFCAKSPIFAKKSLALVQILDYNVPVTSKGHNINNNINQTDTAMITYIVTSTTESYQYSDGHVDSIIERGTAATLSAAKRKARKAAAEHGHHAEISYEEDGKYVLREVNTYGIDGDWVEVR